MTASVTFGICEPLIDLYYLLQELVCELELLTRQVVAPNRIPVAQHTAQRVGAQHRGWVHSTERGGKGACADLPSLCVCLLCVRVRVRCMRVVIWPCVFLLAMQISKLNPPRYRSFGTRLGQLMAQVKQLRRISAIAHTHHTSKSITQSDK